MLLMTTAGAVSNDICCYVHSPCVSPCFDATSSAKFSFFCAHDKMVEEWKYYQVILSLFWFVGFLR